MMLQDFICCVGMAFSTRHCIEMDSSYSSNSECTLLKYFLNIHGRILTLLASCGYNVILTHPEDTPGANKDGSFTK